MHAYKMHEYDAAPKKDARNARHAANDLRRETQAWIQNHAEAKYGNDPRIRKLVNNQREKVEAEYEKLKVTIFELPGEGQIPVQELLAHVEKWLDKCPVFPPELLIEPVSGRLSRSVLGTGPRDRACNLGDEEEKDETLSNPESPLHVAYMRGNDIHAFLIPPPTGVRRDTDQLSLHTEDVNDQEIPPLVDMTLEERRETLEEEGERMNALHKDAAKAYAQGMCAKGYPPNTPQTSRAQEIAEAWSWAQRETERNLPSGLIPPPTHPLVLPPGAVAKKKRQVDGAGKKNPEVGGLSEAQTRMNSKIDELANQVKERCDRLKTAGAGEELNEEEVEILSVALDGDDMCRAWVNSVTDQFIKKANLPAKTYAFKATRKANGELKDQYSFPTQTPQPTTERRREDGRPGAPPARRQSTPNHWDSRPQKEEKPANQRPATSDPAPAQATAPVQTTSNETISLGSSTAANKMIAVSVERECRGVLVGLRPPNNKRFNGDKSKVNFDSHLKAYERAMKVEGATDAIKVGELAHWFTGEAADLCELFYFEEDPTRQLELIIAELTRYYGCKNNTAEGLLERILDGQQIKEGDNRALTTFLIALRKFHVLATQTGKARHFDSPDILNRILRTKLGFLVKYWSKKRVEQGRRGGEEGNDLKFSDLIKFIEFQAEYFETVQTVLGDKTAKEVPKKVVVAALNSAPPQVGKSPQTAGKQSEQQKYRGKKTRPWGPWASSAAVTATGQWGQASGEGVASQTSTNLLNMANQGGVPTGGTQATQPLPKTSTWKCFNCGSASFHNVPECSAFLAADISRRMDMLGRGGYCFKCFCKGHKSIDCENDLIRCDKCALPHNTLMHREYSA